MPDQFTPTFEDIHAENVERVAEELERLKETPEARTASGREQVKKAIQNVAVVSDDDTGQQAAGDTNVIHDPLPEYASGAPAETKLEVEYLLELAFKKGVGTANKAAEKTSPFVMDAFHDALAGRLYPELKKRGAIE